MLENHITMLQATGEAWNSHCEPVYQSAPPPLPSWSYLVMLFWLEGKEPPCVRQKEFKLFFSASLYFMPWLSSVLQHIYTFETLCAILVSFL